MTEDQRKAERMVAEGVEASRKPEKTWNQEGKPKVTPSTLRMLRAELSSLRGGHQREIQADVANLTEQGARQLFRILEDLQSERDSERRKRRMGVSW